MDSDSSIIDTSNVTGSRNSPGSFEIDLSEEFAVIRLWELLDFFHFSLCFRVFLSRFYYHFIPNLFLWAKYA